MNNDGMKFYHLAIAVAVACNADTRPKSNTEPGKAAQFVQDVLEMALASTGLKFEVKPLSYPRCGKTPLVIRVAGRDVSLFWYYPNMKDNDLALELESALNTVLTTVLCETA